MEHGCQRERMAAKRVHVPPDGTKYRACGASSRDSAPSIMWIRACRLRCCGCDRGTRAWPVLGEEARNQWRGWNVVLVIAHGVFSRGRRWQDCMYAGRTSHGRTVDRRAWSAMEGAEGICWEGSGTHLCAWTGKYLGEHDNVSVARGSVDLYGVVLEGGVRVEAIGEASVVIMEGMSVIRPPLRSQLGSVDRRGESACWWERYCGERDCAFVACSEGALL